MALLYVLKVLLSGGDVYCRANSSLVSVVHTVALAILLSSVVEIEHIVELASAIVRSAGLLVELDALGNVLESNAEWQPDAAAIRARMLRILSLVASRYLSEGTDCS